MRLHHIFDSHAHYDDQQFDTDREELLGQRLPAAGIALVVNASSDAPSIRASLALAHRYPYIYCAVGHHPQAAGAAEAAGPGYLQELRRLAADPRVVAIGEIGLDYHYGLSDREAQRRVFRQQLALAGELGLPVIIHSREAAADTLALLREYRPAGVVHCFSGSAETARQVLELGMYLGFTGVVTFKNAKKALQAAQATPLERLLVETDCPYMAPVPVRGTRCDSTLLPHTIEVLARLKGVEPQALCDITYENARRMYRIEG